MNGNCDGDGDGNYGKNKLLVCIFLKKK